MPCKPCHFAVGIKILQDLRVTECPLFTDFQATMTLFDLALRLPARTDKAVLFRQRKRGFHFLKEIAFTSANSVSRSCTSRFSISISPVFEMDSTTSCLPILSCWAYLDAIALLTELITRKALIVGQWAGTGAR